MCGAYAPRPRLRFGTVRRYVADLEEVRRVMKVLGWTLDDGERALIRALEDYQPVRQVA
jgi:hypothetical protein